MPSLSQRDAVVGMDVSKNVIVAGVLRCDVGTPVVESFTQDEASVRRFFGRFDRPERVAACYEAGPTGFELAPSGHLAWCRLRGGRTLVDPEGFRRSGED